MKRVMKMVAVAALAMASVGCAQNYYNVPPETYAQKVRILGVAPIFVDGESDIRHPQKDELVPVMKDFSRRNEKQLVSMIKDTGTYFAVRLLDVDPEQSFNDLFFRRERRDDAGIQYNKYFFKQKELSELIKNQNLDAIMVVTLSGITRHDRIFSSNLLKYLDADYNFMILTAQIIDADGNLLWEYPNFRRRLVSLPPLVSLQYPDFDEAAANLNDKVEIKFKTVPGLKRALEEKEKDVFLREKPVSKLFAGIFSDMVSLLRVDIGERKPEKK